MSEETSLDDFFAKKDKSKKKSKSKTTTSELLLMEEKHARKQRQKREKETQNQAGLTDRQSEEIKVSKQKESEDWQDFEEEQEKDYTGLRIQTLQIAKDPNEEQDEETQEEAHEDENESTGTKATRDLSQGPWKQTTSAVTPAVRHSEPEKPKEEMPKSSGKYIPPSMRGGNTFTQSSTTALRNRPMNKRSAPNISCEMDFPSLGGNRAPPVERSYETIDNPNQRGKLNLTLGNKFSALQD